MRPKEFEDFLKERFGIELPKDIQLSRDKGSAIRVYSTSLNSINLRGSRGFVAYSKKTGISNEFIQIFGKRAKNNIVRLNEEEALGFADGDIVRKKVFIKKGPVIVSYKEHVLGIATFEQGKLFPKVKGKRRRGIENSI